MEAIVVTANSSADLRGLILCGPLRKAFTRVVVVDNTSTDNSVELAKNAGFDVICKRPGGYGEAVNLGAQHVGGDHFAILNPDIRFFDESVIERLMVHFQDPRVGIVAPGLQLLTGEMQDSARRVPTPLDLLIRRLGIDPTRGIVRAPGDVDWVVGACLLVSRYMWTRVGGFDARYRLYFEDVDLCVRVRAADQLVRYDPSVVVEHAHRAASRRTFFGKAFRYHLRSAVLFYFQYLQRKLQTLASHQR